MSIGGPKFAAGKEGARPAGARADGAREQGGGPER